MTRVEAMFQLLSIFLVKKNRFFIKKNDHKYDITNLTLKICLLNCNLISGF